MKPSSEQGFSLIELLVATCILLIVMGVVMTALNQTTKQQQTIWNRTEMHSGVRGATELMQQEVGQAGRLSVPIDIRLQAGVPATANCDPANPGVNATTVQVNSIAGLWATAGAVPASYALVTTMDGAAQESTPVWQIQSNPPQITACFSKAHAANTLISTLGSFGNGIVPPDGGFGSSATVLKMFGDINGDGNMVYVEYTCDWQNAHRLYRNTMPFDAPVAAKPGLGAALVLLNNIQQNPPTAANPGGEPCFTYQTETAPVQGGTMTFVTDVAITLTVKTQQVDSVTKQFQTETKALLNVSPRNVFNALQLAGIGFTDRIQSTPATIAALISS
jgi:prepilin-type N-terminal cleavage/methylation domain-containing protein